MKVGQTVFYIHRNKVHSADIQAKERTDVLSPDGEYVLYSGRIIKTDMVYYTCHGEFREVFNTKEELLASL